MSLPETTEYWWAVQNYFRNKRLENRVKKHHYVSNADDKLPICKAPTKRLTNDVKKVTCAACNRLIALREEEKLNGIHNS